MGQLTPARWSSLGGHKWGSLGGRRGLLQKSRSEPGGGNRLILLKNSTVPTTVGHAQIIDRIERRRFDERQLAKALKTP